MLKPTKARWHSIKQFVALGSLVLFTSVSGCGQAKSPWETVYPATGTVFHKGKPVEGALVRLIPQDSNAPESVRPQAKSNADGTFRIWTYGENDGAPAGSYKVAIVHYPVAISPQGAISTKPNDLPRKYASINTTDLVVEIAKGETQLRPFELK